MVIIMKNLTILLGFFLCFTIVADDHKDKEQTMKDRFVSNPNYLMSFKECKEIKDGVSGLLEMSESTWIQIEEDPENEDKWLEAAYLVEMASNYSKIYNIWCKDMINHRMKMRKMAEMKNQKKAKKEDN